MVRALDARDREGGKEGNKWLMDRVGQVEVEERSTEPRDPESELPDLALLYPLASWPNTQVESPSLSVCFLEN